MLDSLPGTSDGADIQVQLQQFLRTLGDIDRAILLMYLDDRGIAEMADAIGISTGGIRVRIHRLRKRLARWESENE